MASLCDERRSNEKRRMLAEAMFYFYSIPKSESGVFAPMTEVAAPMRTSGLYYYALASVNFILLHIRHRRILLFFSFWRTAVALLTFRSGQDENPICFLENPKAALRRDDCLN